MSIRRWLVCLILGVASAASAQQLPPPLAPPRAQPAQIKPGTGVIAGQVTTADTPPRPIRKVRVTLNMVGRAMPGKTATTDDAGRFEFRELPVGRFDLQAYRPDYVRSNYGARRPNRPGTPVSLADGERKASIVIPMPRGSVIAGSVRDASGAPVSGALVTALSFGYSALTGERTLGVETSGARVRTDDRGTYRAWGLADGEYVVKVDMPVEAGDVGVDDMRVINAADVQRILADARNSAGFAAAATRNVSAAALSAPVKYSSIYYPSATDLASSRTVTLGAGEERDGVDVQMLRVPTARIQGSVRLPDGAPTTSTVTLTLAPTFNPAVATLSQPDRPASAAVDRSWRFSFGGVAPGRYTLTAKMSGPAVWWATTEVVVDGRDVDVALDLQPPMTVNGRLVFEGTTEPPKSFGGTRVALNAPGSGAMISNDAISDEIDAQGKFQVRGVVPGTYSWMQLGGGGETAAWASKSVTANGRDASNGMFQIQPGENVELVFVNHDRPTELAGTLQDTSGRAATEYFVLVFPVDKALWVPRSRRIRSVRPSTDGHFTVRGLAAGDYLIAALTDLANGEQNDPSLLASLVSASIKITLADGQKTTQDLKLAGR